MQKVTGGIKKFSARSKGTTDIDPDRYKERIQLYDLPPIEDISLEEFEQLALERHKALRYAETAKVRWPNKDGEYKSYIHKHVMDIYPFSPTIASQQHEYLKERRRDHISHFILRLAYCRTDELRSWFLNQEVDLFTMRLEKIDEGERARLLKAINFDFEQVSADERRSLGLPGAEAQTMYKIPFERALDLVRSRQCFLKGGVAYVDSKLKPIIASEFRRLLSKQLVLTSKMLPHLDEEERLLPMLKALSEQCIGTEYGDGKSKAGQVSPASIPQLAVESFPLCMRTMQQALGAKHHLRHGARMQYGLFLKGIGLSLEDALDFWRSEFAQSMSVDKFDKNYAYNIRHNYGKEGKRADYTPYSCMKIIMGTPPATGDDHGCPFRHLTSEGLRMTLRAAGVKAKDIGEIMNLVQGRHFQVACTKYFEVTHNVETAAEIIEHPNQFFDESRKLRTDGKHESTSFKKDKEPAQGAEEEAAVDEDDAMLAAAEAMDTHTD